MDKDLLEAQAYSNAVSRLNYGSYGSYGDFATPSANAIRIEANGRAVDAGIENLMDANQFEATNTNINTGHNRICDAINTTATRQADMTTNAEFRMQDRLRDIEREMSANARETARCCCDLKVQAANDKAEILAAISGSETRSITRDLDRAERELTALKTQLAFAGPGNGRA